ncbi:MAG: DUF1385 domain-containing protein [Actinobacteria bacterium]|nr:DUF1385 domain-containing protein [Actinomycetota bacterium]
MIGSKRNLEREGVRAEETRADAVSLRVGGMALENGLLLQTARHWAAAVREADGSIGVTSGAKRFGKPGNAEGGVPVLRGLARLADSFSVIPTLKGRRGSAILPFETPRILGALGLSALVTAASRRLGGSQATQETRALLLGLVPVLLALRDSELAAYHGAEHKAIDEYELTMRGEDAAGAVREHARCGSSLVAPMVATSLAGNIVMRTVMRKPSPATVALGSLLSLGSALEIYRWAGKRPDSLVARGLARSSYLLQHFFTTREPSEEQMEVAREALAELLRLEGKAVSA